jgi:hypothetical protein
VPKLECDVDFHRFASPAHATANRRSRRVVWQRFIVITTVLVQLYALSLDRYGSFRIDDVPAGDYAMTIRLEGNAPGPGRVSRRRFTVPAMEGNCSDEPLDLGTLTLEKR